MLLKIIACFFAGQSMNEVSGLFLFALSIFVAFFWHKN